MDALLLGYDPGGDGKHGVAVLRASGEKLVFAEVSTESTVENVIAWFSGRMESATGLPVGLGVDTLTAWSTGSCGWRPADRKLRSAYSGASNSIAASNSLNGSMAVNGMLVVIQLRKLDPALFVTETHPKVLWYALDSSRYDYSAKAFGMNASLMELLGVRDAVPNNEHEWDALVSAYAAYQARRGRWTTDLHDLPTGTGESLIFPAGRTFFYWPAMPNEHSRRCG